MQLELASLLSYVKIYSIDRRSIYGVIAMFSAMLAVMLLPITKALPFFSNWKQKRSRVNTLKQGSFYLYWLLIS